MSGGNSTFDKLRLIRSPSVGPVTYRQLIARFGSAAAALEALPDLARRGGSARFALAKAELVEMEIAAVASFGARHIFLDGDDYPPLLAEIDNGPACLTVKGRIELASQPSVAIVGARNASAAGCRFARGLAQDLGGQGIVVVSGLARGIDAAAHQGALSCGTIAVIAGGIDNIYPPEHAKLQAEIAERGLLIAEMPPGVEPRARHFPHRNRIIAGMALGTVVVEAVPKSGSLITARLAGEAGREVMAIPGSPLDPRSRGCNQLIREGATLVQDAGDIAELVRPIDQRNLPFQKAASHTAPLAEAGDSERGAVISLLGSNFVTVDELVRQSLMPSAQVQMVLLELELAGKLERGAGGKVRVTV